METTCSLFEKRWKTDIAVQRGKAMMARCALFRIQTLLSSFRTAFWFRQRGVPGLARVVGGFGIRHFNQGGGGDRTQRKIYYSTSNTSECGCMQHSARIDKNDSLTKRDIAQLLQAVERVDQRMGRFERQSWISKKIPRGMSMWS